MKHAKWMIVFGLLVVGVATWTSVAAKPKKAKALYQKAHLLCNEGHYADALILYRKVFATPRAIPDHKVAEALSEFRDCLHSTEDDYEKHMHAVDTLFEELLAKSAYKNNFHLLYAAAKFYDEAYHYGILEDGKFIRGKVDEDYIGNGGGSTVDRTRLCRRRDRIRVLQLLEKAAKQIPATEGLSAKVKLKFYVDFATCFQSRPQQMMRLTDMTTLPELRANKDDSQQTEDYSDAAWGYPLDAKGQPVYFYVPKSYAAAKNDGERWRWLLRKAADVNPDFSDATTVAGFAHTFLGVHTLSGKNLSKGHLCSDGTISKGPFQFDALGETETIALTTAGAKRLALPTEYQFVRHFREAKKDEPLAEIYGNRCQYSQAAAAYERLIEKMNYPKVIKKLEEKLLVLVKSPMPADKKKKAQWVKPLVEIKQEVKMLQGMLVKFRKRNYLLTKAEASETLWASLCQIRATSGKFESTSTHLPGEEVTLDYRFRNTQTVLFKAELVDIQTLLADTQKYIKSAKKRDNGRGWKAKGSLSNIAKRLIKLQENKYLDGWMKSWVMDLTPRDNHRTQRVEVKTPLKKPGAYLVTATTGGGQKSTILVWVSDTMIVEKDVLAGKRLYYIADRTTGKPVQRAKVEFFAYDTWERDNVSPWKTKSFTKIANKNGIVTIDKTDVPRNDGWKILAVASTPKGRLGHLGFERVSYGDESDDDDRNRMRGGLFFISNQPVYRPEQTVKWKFWMNKIDRTKKAYLSPFFGKKVWVRIHAPRDAKAWSGYVTLDKFGGGSGELPLAEGCPLGTYYLRVFSSKEIAEDYLDSDYGLPRCEFSWDPDYWDVKNIEQWGERFGGGTFLVEEYKKPEFEVTVEAPTDPVAAGETVKARVKANYYFGGPATNATVKYKVYRSEFTANWYPPDEWDWLYGKGYWWTTDAPYWHSDSANWDTIDRPASQRSYSLFDDYEPEPELLFAGEGKTDDAGVLEVPIKTSGIERDTSWDPVDGYRYTIEADVTDTSRRMISGEGEVLVVTKPFKVYTWMHREYYIVGDAVECNVQAQRVDGKSVPGKAACKLLRLTRTEEIGPRGLLKHTETLVDSWTQTIGDDGRIHKRLKTLPAGEYRFSCTVTDATGKPVEGVSIFIVWGKNDTGEAYSSTSFSLCTDQKLYKPGDTVNLRVVSSPGSTVLLFVRTADGRCTKPNVLHFKGSPQIVPIKVTVADMPNFFVEAMTVRNGYVSYESRMIPVPPQKRIAKVKIESDQTTYRPGKIAKLKLRITDSTGEPFSGQVALTMYDKSLEYISGGSNVPDILRLFWGDVREYRSYWPTYSLAGSSPGLPAAGSVSMSDLMDLYDPGDHVPYTGKRKHSRGSSMLFGDFLDDSATGGGIGRTYDVRDLMARVPSFAGPRVDLGSIGGHSSSLFDDGSSASAGSSSLFADSSDSDMGKPAKQVKVNRNVMIRSKFADSSKWISALGIAKDGLAEIEVVMPEDLTTWKTRVWVMGPGCVVGEATVELITTKKVICRLQAPRFFVQNDECVLSGVVMNRSKTAQTFEVPLGLAKSPLTVIVGAKTQSITVPAGGSKRVDWRVKITAPGDAKITMTAAGTTEELSDAMQKTFPCKPHGMLRTESFSAVLPPDVKETSIKLRVPSERQPGASRLEIRYSPSLAGSLLDALPYLNKFPYGCTEQTLNRFLPTVIARNTLKVLKISPEQVNARTGTKSRPPRSSRYDRDTSGVFDLATLNTNVAAGVTRLLELQNSKGGWNWLYGRGECDPHATAVVLHGLLTAKACGATISDDVLEEGLEWLENYLDERIETLEEDARAHAEELDVLVALVLLEGDMEIVHTGYLCNLLYPDRKHLSLSGQVLLAQLLVKGEDVRAPILMKLLAAHLKTNPKDQTAWLTLPKKDMGYRWYNSEIETNAAYLKLLAMTKPKAKPAMMLANAMLAHRSNGNYWESTRDTACCIEAMAAYLKASAASRPNMTIEVLIDGTLRKTAKITPETLFAENHLLVLTGDAVTDGPHTITLRRKGKGAVFLNAYLTNYTKEDAIAKAGNAVTITRTYSKLVPDPKAPGGYRRVNIPDAFADGKPAPMIRSGDLLEVELTVTAKQDSEYILIRDFKPAGCETVDLKSGYTERYWREVYREFRDDHVCYFARWLEKGTHRLHYRTRAEIPGVFSAMPAKVEAMYAPTLRGNSNEHKITIVDKKK